MCGKKKNRVGEKYANYQGYEIEIVEYFGALNSTIKFNDDRGTIRKNVAFKEIQLGSIKNLYHKSVYNMGFFGDGMYKAKVNNKTSRCYNSWVNMLGRCYDTNNLRAKSYGDVVVCEE